MGVKSCDMLGNETSDQSAAVRGRSKRKEPRPSGHAWHIGTGAAGETCGSCANVVRMSRYMKCGLAKAKWTCGRKTDVLARDSACKFWTGGADS